MKRLLIILSIIALALLSLSLIETREEPALKTHEEHWEEAFQDLQETFDLSEEDVTDLEELIF